MSVTYMKKVVSHTLTDLLHIKLKALYDIEQQLVKTLPAMVEHSTDKELKKAFKTHLAETKIHVKRIEQAFKLLGKKPTKTKVEAIRGLIEDANWVIKNIHGPEAKDAALIATAAYIGHYEMAGYMSAIDWAVEMGELSVADLLRETISEEIQADELLAAIGEERLNKRANG